jgi:hypothetical protein
MTSIPLSTALRTSSSSSTHLVRTSYDVINIRYIYIIILQGAVTANEWLL